MKALTIDDFYKDTAKATQEDVDSLLPPGIKKEIGHFNVFSVADLATRYKADPRTMVYNQREYYKVSLIRGKSIVEYADKVIDIEKYALLFATPKIPYRWVPLNEDQKGYFCVFTSDFLLPSKSGMVLDDLPLFRPGACPVFQISKSQADNMVLIYKKMQEEMSSAYLFKYDLIRNFLMELIHYGQKLEPLTTYNYTHNASARISSLFIELLERQFPIASPEQKFTLRTAKDYADRLSVHSNHLNKVLKENTGKTTTEHITNRLIQEAKILLKQTDWNISEIAYSLGFEQLSHFSSFFKKQTHLSPIEIRTEAI